MGHHESLYCGAAKHQLDILRKQMELGGLKIGERRVKLGEDIEVLCSINYNYEEVLVRTLQGQDVVEINSKVKDYGIVFTWTNAANKQEHLGVKAAGGAALGIGLSYYDPASYGVNWWNPNAEERNIVSWQTDTGMRYGKSGIWTSVVHNGIVYNDTPGYVLGGCVRNVLTAHGVKKSLVVSVVMMGWSEFHHFYTFTMKLFYRDTVTNSWVEYTCKTMLNGVVYYPPLTDPNPNFMWWWQSCFFSYSCDKAIQGSRVFGISTGLDRVRNLVLDNTGWTWSGGVDINTFHEGFDYLYANGLEPSISELEEAYLWVDGGRNSYTPYQRIKNFAFFDYTDVLVFAYTEYILHESLSCAGHDEYGYAIFAKSSNYTYDYYMNSSTPKRFQAVNFSSYGGKYRVTTSSAEHTYYDGVDLRNPNTGTIGLLFRDTNTINYTQSAIIEHPVRYPMDIIINGVVHSNPSGTLPATTVWTSTQYYEFYDRGEFGFRYYDQIGGFSAIDIRGFEFKIIQLENGKYANCFSGRSSSAIHLSHGGKNIPGHTSSGLIITDNPIMHSDFVRIDSI
jgi:hypothetical protein